MLLVDTTADELIGICDTIVVLHQGTITLYARGSTLRQHQIIEASYGTAALPA